MATQIEQWATNETHGGFYVGEAAVRHALGEHLPDNWIVRRLNGLIEIEIFGEGDALTELEARQLAGVLLAAADELSTEEAT